MFWLDVYGYSSCGKHILLLLVLLLLLLLLLVVFAFLSFCYQFYRHKRVWYVKASCPTADVVLDMLCLLADISPKTMCFHAFWCSVVYRKMERYYPKVLLLFDDQISRAFYLSVKFWSRLDIHSWLTSHVLIVSQMTHNTYWVVSCQSVYCSIRSDSVTCVLGHVLVNNTWL